MFPNVRSNNSVLDYQQNPMLHGRKRYRQLKKRRTNLRGKASEVKAVVFHGFGKTKTKPMLTL